MSETNSELVQAATQSLLESGANVDTGAIQQIPLASIDKEPTSGAGGLDVFASATVRLSIGPDSGPDGASPMLGFEIDGPIIDAANYSIAFANVDTKHVAKAGETAVHVFNDLASQVMSKSAAVGTPLSAKMVDDRLIIMPLDMTKVPPDFGIPALTGVRPSSSIPGWRANLWLRPKQSADWVFGRTLISGETTSFWSDRIDVRECSQILVQLLGSHDGKRKFVALTADCDPTLLILRLHLGFS